MNNDTASEAKSSGSEDNPYDGPKARERHSQGVAAAAAMEERKKRWKAYWFAVAELDGLREPWADKVAWHIANVNAKRDPTRDLPSLMFNGATAVEAGAADGGLASLARLSPDEMATLRLKAAAMRQDSRSQVDALANSLRAVRETTVPTPTALGLDALLAEPDEDLVYRVDGLWPTAGRILLSAQYKSGKSTLVGNIIRSLVDGEPFLGKFDVARARRVVLIDTELDTRTLRRWLRDQRIDNATAVSVLPLRGAVSTFDILDSRVRSGWARQLSGADVVILDCLRPIIDALGLSEDKDAGRVLVAFDALLAEIGAQEGMVVTHMGHHNERARGDSRLLDWPDALWKIVRGGDDASDETARPRFFSALGRDVELSEGQLAFDRDTRHLTLAGGSRTESRAAQTIEKKLADVLDVLADNAAAGGQGMNTGSIKQAVGGRKDTVDKALSTGVDRALIGLTRNGRAKLYRLNPVAPQSMPFAV